MDENRTSEWVGVAVCVVILAAGLYRFELGPEPAPPTQEDQVEILSWNWKQDRTGRILAVFGSVRNTTPEAFSRVILELRTEDAAGQVLARHAIEIGRVAANAEKPFREDIPRTGRESMGFLEVQSVGR